MNSQNTSPKLDVSALDPMLWQWPAAPHVFTLHDKYADVSARLELGASVWAISVQGQPRKFKFTTGEEGIFQQKLVLLTQAKLSPSSFYKFTFTLLRHWDIFRTLLQTDPNDIKLYWDKAVNTIDLAKTAKSILKLAARHSVGPWNETHQKFIKDLNTRANGTVADQKTESRNDQSYCRHRPRPILLDC